MQKKISFPVLIIVITMAFNCCKKDMGSANSFPVNESFAADLISKGVPTDIAQFYAAAKLESHRLSDTICTYLQTFPNGATREITLHIRPNRKYTPTKEEIANITPGKYTIYDFHYTASILADSSTKIVLNYFVAKASLPIGEAQQTQSSLLMSDQTRSINTGTGETEGAGILWEEIGKKGTDVSINSLIDYAKEGKIKVGPLKSIYNLASALSDVTTALLLSKQNKAWLAELDALIKCASNPTNQVAQNDPNYSQSTVSRLEGARSELKQVNAVRFLNIMTEKGADLNPVTSAVGIGLKPGFEWSEQTLNDYSENTIMREARLTVIPCEDAGAPAEGNIDVLSDCTVSGPINITHTVEHIVTKVAWIYDPQTTQYFSQGSYTIDYTQTITGGGTTCAIKRTGAGYIGNSGTLMVINDPALQQLLGYGYIADGNVDGAVEMSATCPGYTPQMQNWTIRWLPQIKAFTGTRGTYKGDMTIPLCGGGADSGSEKVTWSFTVPPSK